MQLLPAVFRVKGRQVYRQLTRLAGLSSLGESGPVTRDTPGTAVVCLHGEPLPGRLTLAQLLRALVIPYAWPGALPFDLLDYLQRQRVTVHNHIAGRADSRTGRIIRPKWRPYLRL